MVEIKDGKISIGVSYGVKVPGATKFSSQEKSTWLTLEYAVDGLEGAAAVDKALELETSLDTAVKLAVLSSLGLQPEYIAEGVIVPQWPADRPEEPKPQRSGGGGGYRSSGGGNGGRRSGGGGNSAASDAPRIEVETAFYQGTVIDARALKESGVYAANAPDFKTPGRDGPAWWLKGRDGSPNPEAQLLAKLFDDEAPF